MTACDGGATSESTHGSGWRRRRRSTAIVEVAVRRRRRMHRSCGWRPGARARLAVDARWSTASRTWGRPPTGYVGNREADDAGRSPVGVTQGERTRVRAAALSAGTPAPANTHTRRGRHGSHGTSSRVVNGRRVRRRGARRGPASPRGGLGKSRQGSAGAAAAAACKTRRHAAGIERAAPHTRARAHASTRQPRGGRRRPPTRAGSDAHT